MQDIVGVDRGIEILTLAQGFGDTVYEWCEAAHGASVSSSLSAPTVVIFRASLCVVTYTGRQRGSSKHACFHL